MAPAVFTIQLKEINANFRIDKRWNILKVSPIKHLFILKTLLSSYFLGEKPFWTMFSHLFLLAPCTSNSHSGQMLLPQKALPDPPNSSSTPTKSNYVHHCAIS